jgi:hypothetical protein
MTAEKVLRIFITAVAIVIALIHLAVPTLLIDSITLALLVIAILPWLSPIIKSIELPGGFKLELQELKKELAEVKGAAQSAENKATFAIAQTEPEAKPAISGDAHQEYERLAQTYNEIRAAQKPGDARTRHMTEIVQKMVSLVPQLKNFDVLAALSSQDAGKRLSGYAYLYAAPDFSKLPALVHTATQIENQPFGQYWSLQTIDKVLYNKPRNAVVDESVHESLKNFLARLEPGTDRHYELSRILRAYFS